MATKFDMIKAADTIRAQMIEESTNIVAHLAAIAQVKGKTLDFVAESAMSLLANIAVTADSGKPIKLMHTNSVAAFLAGVETIAQALPKTDDEIKKQNTLRALAVSGIGDDGSVNDATFPIVNLGARKEAVHQKWAQMVGDYVKTQASGQPQGEALSRAVRQLQQKVDMAMRTSAQPRSTAPIGQSSAGTATA